MTGSFHLPKGSRFDILNNRWTFPSGASAYNEDIDRGTFPKNHNSAKIDELDDGIYIGGNFFSASIDNVDWDPDTSDAVIGPPLGGNERGIIIGPKTDYDRATGKVRQYGSYLDRQELNMCLLYWDRVDFPENMVVSIDQIPEYDILMSAGVLVRSQVMPFGTGGAIFGEAYFDAFKANEKRSPGRWAISQGERSLRIMGKDVEEVGRGLLVNLNRCVPVPEGGIPFEEILIFRDKRRSEMLALRDAIDGLARQVAQSPDDPDWAKSAAFDQIDRAVSNQLKVSKESGLRTRLMTVAANIGISDLIKPSVAFVASMVGGKTLLSAAGMAAATVSIESGFAIKDMVQTKSSDPFRYVSHMHKELWSEGR